MPDLPKAIRPRQGSLVGSAPTAHQTRSVPVTIEEVRPGVMRLTTPFGWLSELAYDAPGLARIVASAFLEAQLYNHTRWRGHDENGRALYQRPRPPNPGERADVHDPRAWRKDRYGLFVSPSGRRYRPDAQVARKVREGLMEFGGSGEPELLDEAGGESQLRADSRDPRAWRLEPDGRYLSPSGRRWSPNSHTAAKVRQRLAELGLPAIPKTLEDTA